MKTKEYVKRYTLFVIGLFFCSLGIALTKSGELGVSPISSVPNVLSVKFTFMSMGDWLFVWNSLTLLAQILILRKKFQLFQLLQLPLNLLYSLFTDGCLWLVSFLPVPNYFFQIVMVLAGTVVLGFGIALSVTAGVILITGEALVKTIAETLHKKFGNVKIVFDVSCALLSVILSLIFFDLKLVGTREGTVIAALGVGSVVKFFQPRLQKLQTFLKA